MIFSNNELLFGFVFIVCFGVFMRYEHVIEHVVSLYNNNEIQDERIFLPNDVMDPWKIVTLSDIIKEGKAEFMSDYNGKYMISNYRLKYTVNDEYVPVGDVAIPWNKPTTDADPTLLNQTKILLIKNDKKYCSHLTRDDWHWVGNDKSSGDSQDWSVLVVKLPIKGHVILGSRCEKSFASRSNYVYAAPKTQYVKENPLYRASPYNQDIMIWNDKDTGFYWDINYVSKTTPYNNSYWISITRSDSEGSDKFGYTTPDFKHYNLVLDSDISHPERLPPGVVYKTLAAIIVSTVNGDVLVNKNKLKKSLDNLYVLEQEKNDVKTKVYIKFVVRGDELDVYESPSKEYVLYASVDPVVYTKYDISTVPGIEKPSPGTTKPKPGTIKQPNATPSDGSKYTTIVGVVAAASLILVMVFFAMSGGNNREYY